MITLRELRTLNDIVEKPVGEWTDQDRERFNALDVSDFERAAELNKRVQAQYQAAAQATKEVAALLAKYGGADITYDAVKDVMSPADRYAILTAFQRLADANKFIAEFNGTDQ